MRVRAKEALRFIPPLLVVAMIYLGTRGCIEELAQSPSDFSPVTLKQLAVEPETLRRGDRIKLLDGLCNDSDQTLNLQIYLGAQSVGSPLNSRTVNLLRRTLADGTRQEVTDTPEGRLGYVLEPGCVLQEPIEAPLPEALTPGEWELKARIIVNGPNGEVQNLAKTSNTFRVCGAEC